MFKKITSLAFIFGVLIIIVGCQSKKSIIYKEEAGVYELYSMNGDLNQSMFESYTIELKADGKVNVKEIYIENSRVEESTGDFKIKDYKITFEIKEGSKIVTRVYDYIGGKIIMYNVTKGGNTFSALFKRAITEDEVLPYEKEAGVYKLISMTGDANVSMFETYTIELKADGEVNVRVIYTENSTVVDNYENYGAFEIKNDKIYIRFVGNVNEVYDYINGNIIINYNLYDVTFTAKFRRVEEK